MAFDQEQQTALLAQVTTKDKLRALLTELDNLLGVATERGEGRVGTYQEPGDITDETLWTRVAAAVNAKWGQIESLVGRRPTL